MSGRTLVTDGAAPAPLTESAAVLTTANLVCAAIGAAQGLLVVRLLGPEGFGAAAVIAALAAVACNIVDARLMDLISNLYFNEHASSPTTGLAYRHAALRLVLRLYIGSAALIVLIAAGVSVAGVPHLTRTPIPVSWLWAAAFAQGISYFGGFFIFIQRFGLPLRRMASVQLASAVLNAVVMIGAVSLNPGVGGYITGLLASACGIATLNMLMVVRHFRSIGTPLFRVPREQPPEIDLRLVRRFLASGNMFGYVKLLHRSADVLLVAAFCGDRDTGIYKLARSITDVLHAMSEAISRVYQPRLLALLQSRDYEQFRATARVITSFSAVLTAGALVGGIVLVPYIAPMLGVDDALELTVCVTIMTFSFFFVAGLHTWIWPLFVHAGNTSRGTVWGGVAVLVGQYTIGPALAHMTGHAIAAWFCLGYLSYYCVSVYLMWRDARTTYDVLSPARQVAAI
jgi:O-antigen/teichoic acid export membrane protein